MSAMSMCSFSRAIIRGQSKHASLRASKARVAGSSVKALRMSSAKTVTRKNVVTFVTKAEIDIEAEIEAIKEETKKDDKKPKLVGAEREKFAVIGSGQHQCKSCSYIYDQSKGDAEFPVAAGTTFEQLPGDWICPTCGANKTLFEALGTEVAGFAENQGYGIGGNSMTSGQKSLLIYGTLAFFFALFIAGYFLD